MSDFILFEGRKFEREQLTGIRLNGTRIVALYHGSPIIVHVYSTQALAREGIAYLRRRVGR